jgi:uncharacterized membrane protein (DUF485 family)
MGSAFIIGSGLTLCGWALIIITVRRARRYFDDLDGHGE